MKKEIFYEILDIEHPGDFQYFDNIAELFETSEDVEIDDVYELIQDVDMEVFGELIQNYFADMEDWIPERETDFILLMDNIERSFLGLAQNLSARDDDKGEDLHLRFAEEIVKFRDWYTLSENVECISNSTGESSFASVRDALSSYKESKMGGTEYYYDCKNAMEYSIEEYVMKFDDLIELSE